MTLLTLSITSPGPRICADVLVYIACLAEDACRFRPGIGSHPSVDLRPSTSGPALRNNTIAAGGNLDL